MSSRELGPCLICDNVAVGINFAVPTCAPCKAFFRRNAMKFGKADFICQTNGKCPIRYELRRSCNRCRLAKCFRVGMDKSLIRSKNENEARKELVQQIREKREQLIKNQSSDMIRPSNLLCSTYTQSKCLSSSDQTLLTNLSSAYERTYITIINKTSQYFPSKPHSSLHVLFNGYNDRFLSLIEYFKLIPEFNQISTNDKIGLIRNHYGTIVTFIESTNEPEKYNALSITLKKVFGMDLGVPLVRCLELIQGYGRDIMLLKLLLIVCSLTTDIKRNLFDTDMNYIYDDTLRIFASQNVYVELLWKYLLSRLASERDVVKFFNKLILDLVFMVHVSFITDSFVYSVPNEIDQMVPLMQSMWPAPERIMKIQNNGSQ